jgi:hypothetical protein
MKQEQSSEEFVNDLKRMHARVIEVGRQLADAMNGKLPEDQHVDPSMLMVSSMISHRTHEPMIMLRWFTFVAQIGPEQALNRLVEHYKAWCVNQPGGRR